MSAPRPALAYVARRPDAGRVWLRTIAVGPLGGAVLGALVWSALCLPTGSGAGWMAGLPLALPVGAVIGLVLGVVAGGVLAAFHACRPDGLAGAEAHGVAALAAGGPVLLVSGLPGLTSPTYVVVFVVPLTIVTAFVAAAVAPRLVAPVWSAVSARPSDAAAAGGTASPGWSPAPGR